MNSRPRIRAVAEIVLNVSDLEQARQFYEGVLGFEHHSQFPGEEPTIVFLRIAQLDTALGCGGHPQLLALIDPERHPPARAAFRGLDVSRSSLNHLAFEIDASDYASELARLKSFGLDVSEQVFPHMSAKALFFRDPDGNLLELICHAESTGDP